MIPVVIILVVVVVVLGIVIATLYNRLIGTRNHTVEAWSNVETELKRRYDLIPNLIETVRGYAKHERSLLEEVTTLRERAQSNNGSAQSQAADEVQLERSLGRLFARLEAYPDLKANQNFVELQRELANTEDRIQASLRFYNGNVRDHNNRVQQFPSNMVAGMFNFDAKEPFELENPDAARAINVEF